MCFASYLIWFAHKEKQQLNRQIVIIHEFQLSEILTRADFFCKAQIINPSIKVLVLSQIYDLHPVIFFGLRFALFTHISNQKRIIS